MINVILTFLEEKKNIFNVWEYCSSNQLGYIWLVESIKKKNTKKNNFLIFHFTMKNTK